MGTNLGTTINHLYLPGVITWAEDPLPFDIQTEGELRFAVTFEFGDGLVQVFPVDSDEKELALAVALGFLYELRALPSFAARLGFARGVIEGTIDHGHTVPYGSLMISIEIEI